MNLDAAKESIFKLFSLANIDFGKLHFFVILAIVFMEMLDRGTPYRFFAYLNLLFLMAYFIGAFKQVEFADFKTIFTILVIPTSFIVLHLVAVWNFDYTREFQRIMLVTFLVFGIWAQAKINPKYVKDNIFKFTLIVLLLYVVAQLVALWLLNRPFGTTSNPHYLAFYSASCLIFTSYSLYKIPKLWRWFLLIPFAFLGYFILLSSSRPTWIGLIFTSLLMMLLVEPKIRKYSALVVVLLLATLVITNAANFSGRFVELLTNLTTEERATIWQEAWKMQNNSTFAEWIFGHGFNAFLEAFKQYSTYHLYGEDFKTPHNFILELLYTSGLAGLSLATLLVFWIYKQIFQLMESSAAPNGLALLLLATLTTNLITVSITVSFFSGFNLIMLAIVAGIVLFIKENNAINVMQY